MHQVAILTPNPADATYAGLWPGLLARLQAALAGEGIDAVPEPWTAHVDDASALSAYACVLPLLAWGYHHEHARWLRACETWRQAGTPLWNPADVLAWNSDKRYLETLAARGVAVPHTVSASTITRELLDETFDTTGADALIVKPAVSGGAWKTQRVRRGAAVEDTGMTMLVQSYLPTIASEGETSLLYFGGQLSHVVNKRPPQGEFRVQQQFGGAYTLLDAPPAGALALAEATLAAIGTPLLYARIDMVPDEDGRWLLMEAELIEPDLYLGVDPRGGTGFAGAVRGLFG
jgi:hypothetical protein